MSGLNSILTGLQNPNAPDLAGSFEQGQTKGFMGQILQESFGGKLGALGKANPDKALALAERLGIPKNEKERFNAFVGTIQAATALANGPGGAQAAAQLMQEHSDRLRQINPEADTSRIDKMIEFIGFDEASGINGLNLMNDSLMEQGFIADPDTRGAQQRGFDDLTEGLTSEEKQSARRIKLGLDPRAVGSSSQTIASDPRLTDKVAGSEGKIAGAKDAGKAAIKRSEEAFTKVEAIRANMLNLDEGVRLIDSGAETGPILALLPSVRKSAVLLNNLQGKLGLDVISNTTFGALSESELAFALKTALPDNLEGPALREWLVNKKVAQEKLAGYLTDVASFLGTPGNTTADWIELQQARQVGRDNPDKNTASESGNIGRFTIEVIE